MTELAALLALLRVLSAPKPSPECAENAKDRVRCQPSDIVVTGARTPESSQRATVRTEFVSREEAETRGATNVAEALAGEPTLQVNPEAYGHLGRPSGVQMQGLDAERVLVLEDGERVIGDVGGVVDLAELPLVDVERIEYVAGPMSSLYGSNALGGVINIIGAEPRAEGLGLRYRAEARTSGEVLASTSAAYRQRHEWVAVDGSIHRRPSLTLAEDSPENYVPEWLSTTLGFRAGSAPDRRMKLRLRGRWLRDRSHGLASQSVPGLGVYLVDLPQTTDRFGLRAQETLTLGRSARLDFSLAQSLFIDDEARDRRNSPVDENRHRHLQNQSLESTLTLADGPTRTWVFGVRTEAERFWQTLQRTAPDLETTQVQEIEPTLLASSALFGQLGAKPFEPLTLMLGARAELHDRYGAVAAPRLAAALQASRDVSVRVAVGRGFRAPSAKEYGFVFDHSALGYRVIGNPDLEPETSWGASADVTFRTQELRARVGAFSNWVEQLIATTLAPLQPQPGVTDYTYENIDDARTAGADLSLRAVLMGRVTLDAAYAYLFTRDDTGSPLPSRPAHTVTLSARVLLPWRLAATLRYRVVSDAFVGTLNAEEIRSPAFGSLDARLAFAALPGLEVFLGGLNLTDSQREPLDLGDARPAFGRQFYLGVRGELPDPELAPN